MRVYYGKDIKYFLDVVNGVYYKLRKNEPLHCFVTIFADDTSHVFILLCRTKIPPKRLWVLL